MPEKSIRSFYVPILRVLKEMGGEGNRSEIISRVAQERNFTEEDMNETTASGERVIRKRVYLARYHLVATGYLQKSEQSSVGIWTLSEMGQKADLKTLRPQDIHREYKKNRGAQPRRNQKKLALEDSESEELPDEDKLQEELLRKLRGLSFVQFERICLRLMRTIGFVDVRATSPTKDGGFDGYGYLEINSLVKTKVVFESKRYQAGNSVGVDAVRRLQAAIDSRNTAERGVIITTSDFTAEAKKEAESGKASIQLINSELLVDLFVKHELGVKKIYAVDDAWFSQFTENEG